MIGDGKRKRAAKRTAAKPDAEAVLAEAERQLGVARQHLGTLRHQARTAHSEMRSHLAEADAELRAAGLELREPRGAEQMQLDAQRKEWEVHAFEAQIVGAERAVATAEGAVAAALLGAYPTRAAQLDAAAERLTERRKRTEAELEALAALEAEHRESWARLLSVIPGGFATTFVPREFLETRFSEGTEIPRSVQPTWRPERGEGLTSDLAIDEAWPSWLQDAVRRAQSTPMAPTAPMITQPPAVFEEDTFVHADAADFGELIQRARAADRDADKNQITLER